MILLRTIALLLAMCAIGTAAPDPFKQHIRPTEALTPEQELAALHAPPGFEIQLFASEPQINKPMNMAFDARGRLWVTNTVEYPFPVALDEVGRDSIKVLADTNGDGAADQVSTFVDGLNIPTGVVPYGSGCIAWSIPNIWFFDDTDGDGKCDTRKKLYGPFGWEKDTHGMNSSFRLGLDGWVYATHGFNNATKVAGTDGHEVTMQSGHVYRFRPDGSRIEIYSHGQVNPFGLCFDSRGYLYSADCHSWPITQLIQGAYYPSFGKPHDGLGFGPRMIQHTHDSTGLCGIVYLDDKSWPADFQHNTLLGDVLNCRVRRDQITFNGSSPTANKRDDFIRSDDPWFRPVDLQYGPDGALYIADFYNKIIGHYEVALDHPGRDRERGRIWRVTAEGNAKTLANFDLTKWTSDQVLAAMDSTNRTLAEHATSQLSTFDFDPDKAPPLTKENTRAGARALHLMQNSESTMFLRGGDPQSASGVCVGALQHSDPFIRLHASRALAASSHWSANAEPALRAALADADPHVIRAAAIALATRPSPASTVALAKALERCPAEDTHLRHTLRVALRDSLADAEAFAELGKIDLPPAERRLIASFAASAGSSAGAEYIVDHAKTFSSKEAAEWLLAVAPNIPIARHRDTAAVARDMLASRPSTQLKILSALKGSEQIPELKNWAAELVASALSEDAQPSGWQSHPHPELASPKSPWFRQERNSADGESAAFFCSLPEGGRPGESLTGLLRSPPFELKAEVSFYLAGHDGSPDKPAGGKSYIRLVDIDSGDELARTSPPRNDTAQRVAWKVEAHAGKRCVVEIIDGDTGDAYAWLAAGRFREPELAVSELSGQADDDLLRVAARVAARYGLDNTAPALRKKLASKTVAPRTRSRIASTLATFATRADRSDAPLLVAAAPLLADDRLPKAVAERITNALSSPDAGLAAHIFANTGPAPRRRFAENLAGTVAGAEILVTDAPASDLVAPSVTAKLAQHSLPELQKRIAEKTANASPHDKSLDTLITERIHAFDDSVPDRAWGGRVFAKHCAICHQFRGDGKVVGPQLDGVHTRGAARLIEDILAPNRHIDPNFRLNVLKKTDGSVVSGMARGENDGALQLVDVLGKVNAVPLSEIAERQVTALSLMPPTFGESLSAKDFQALVGFLLTGE